MRKSKRKRPTDRQLAAMAQSQQGRCGICHMPLTATGIEVDHIVPVARKGGNAIRNLRLVHGSCNRLRGDRI